MKGRIRLSALGLKNACSNPQMKNEDKMFTFYIGNIFFKLSHFSADFLFPKIAKMHINIWSLLNGTHLNDDKNAWLQIDFKNKKVHPTHYSIRSRHEGKPKGDNNLVNWNIEGSNSGNESDWKVLDQRLNVTCLDELCAQNTFDISVHLDPNESFRFLRIRQTGMDSEGLYWMTFSAIEYFGFLYTQ